MTRALLFLHARPSQDCLGTTTDRPFSHTAPSVHCQGDAHTKDKLQAHRSHRAIFAAVVGANWIDIAHTIFSAVPPSCIKHAGVKVLSRINTNTTIPLPRRTSLLSSPSPRNTQAKHTVPALFSSRDDERRADAVYGCSVFWSLTLSLPLGEAPPLLPLLIICQRTLYQP